MRSLVHFTGSFPIDKLKKIVSQAEFLAEEPQLKIDEIFVSGNPQWNYREIFVSWTDSPNRDVKYHVMDMGRVNDVPATISIGSKIYSEKDVEELKISRILNTHIE